jgi:hypothetical protein
VVSRKPRLVQPAEPAHVYESVPRKGGGRTHLMPVSFLGSEVEAPEGYRHISFWIMPMLVNTDIWGRPQSIGVIESRAVAVDVTVTPR